MADHEARPRSRAAAVDRRAPIPAPSPIIAQAAGWSWWDTPPGRGCCSCPVGRISISSAAACRGRVTMWVMSAMSSAASAVRTGLLCCQPPRAGYGRPAPSRWRPAPAVARPPGRIPRARGCLHAGRLLVGPARPTWILRVHPAQV